MIFKFKARASACALGVAALLLIAVAGRPAGSHHTTKKPAGQHDTSGESSARPVIESTDETNDLDSNREKEFFREWVGGELDVETTRKMWDQALSVPSEPPSNSLQAVDSWQLVGPLYSTNPEGGRMTGRVRDIEARTVRVLAASGGLWSFNFGPNPISETLPASWFGTFTTSPNNPGTILLGTGEYGIGGGTGLYKTEDGGATWQRKPVVPQPGAFTRIRYSPDGATIHATSTSGYYRSTNNGETWTRTLEGIATDLSTLNGDASLLYVTVANSGLWQSDNAGLTWTQFTTGGIPTGLTGNGAVSAMRLSPSEPVWIYVAFTYSGVWRSSDGGTTWTDITPSPGIGNAGYGPAISVCPGNPNLVLVGDVGARRSTNGGASWTAMLNGHLHADYHVFSWDANNTGVWAGHDGGWSHSNDQGVTWETTANVMPITQFYNIECENTEVGYILGGSQDNGISFTPNQALFWSNKHAGDGAGTCVDAYNLGRMWAIDGVYGGSLAWRRFRTTNGGADWTDINVGIEPNNRPGVIRTDNAFNPWLVTSAGAFVYDSFDLGDTWTKSNATAFPSNVRELTSSTRVSPTAVLYACLDISTPGQRLYVRDGGNWYERSAGLPPGSVRTVTPHPWSGNFADQAWALMNGTGNPGQKIFRTADRGVNWTNITGNLPDVPLGDVVVDPRHTSHLVVGTMLGCYRTLNDGVSWERWNNGMTPGVMVNEMSYIDLTPTTGAFWVVAGTYGRSVFKREITGSDPGSNNQPPDCSAAAPSIDVLWPANHQMVSVGITGLRDPDGDPVTVTITRITQDEPVTGQGDNTTPDGDGVGTSVAQVRAECSRRGNGRVYVIAFTATDGLGAECSGTVEVCVPLNIARGATCIDDGLAVNSLESGESQGQRNGTARGLLRAVQSSHLTAIEYGLDEAGEVDLGVFNVAGRRVATLVNGRQVAGAHIVTWDSRRSPHGVYYLRLFAPGANETVRIVLTR